MDATMHTIGFEQLLDEAATDPDGIAATLRLAGIDDTTVGILLDHADERALGPTDFDYSMEAREERMTRHASSEGEEILTSLEVPVSVEEHLQLGGDRDHWEEVKGRLADWWQGVDWRRDTNGEPATVKVRTPLYAIAVTGDAPPGTSVVCSWATDRSVTGGIDLSLGVLGLGLTRTTKLSDGRTLRAERGRCDQVFAEASVVLMPARLYVRGQATERMGVAPTDLIFSRPLAIGTESPTHIPRAGGLALRRYPKEQVADPKPPTYTQSVERGRTFGLKVPLGTDWGELGIRIRFGGSWSAELELNLPVGHDYILCPLDDRPGAIVTVGV